MRLYKTLVKWLNVDTLPLEFLLGAVSVILGIKIFLSENVFASPAYTWLKLVTPGDLDELFWGITLLGTGLLKFASLNIDDLRYRRFTSLLNLSTWILIDASFWISYPQGLGAVNYLIEVIIATWVLISISFKVYKNYGSNQ